MHHENIQLIRPTQETVRRLIDNGYAPVPIPSGQKRPKAFEWPKRTFSEGDFEDGCNIGIRCGDAQVSLLDVDIYCESVVSSIVSEWNARFGALGSKMRRTGEAPKTGIPFRTDPGAAKTSEAVRPTGKAPLGVKGKPKIEQVEVLATGQQFVAYGIHPDTQQPYRWHGLDPADNFLGRAEDLPYVSTTEVAEFLAWVAEQFGPETKTLPLSERAKPNPGIKVDFGTDGGVIEAFNKDHSLQDLLQRYGYRHRHGDHWTSPNSGTGSANVQVLGDRWRSLSGSDATLGVGAKSGTMKSQTGDAFDLYVYYEHAGDFSAAVRAYGRQADIKTSSTSVRESTRATEPDDAAQQLQNGRKDNKREFRLIRVGELEFREPEYLLPPMLEADALTLIFGEPGCGKSFLALDIAARVSLGVSDHAA